MAARNEASDPSFRLLSEGDLKEILDDSDAASTKKSIKYSYSKLERFAELKHVSLEGISTGELDKILAEFYPAVRKTDGEQYAKKSLQYVRYGIQRHFLDNRNIDICSKSLFPESNRMFKAVLVKLKRDGLGSTKHKESINSADMEKIFSSPELDCNTPNGLQNKVFIDLMTFFCNRGRENVRNFKTTDFSIRHDEDGLRYVTRRDLLTKNHRENDDEKTGGYMYEVPNSDKCPVKSFEKYVAKLHPACEWLWQKPKQAKAKGTVPLTESEPWYCNSPVGINTLANKMKHISTAAGCSKIYTNHCLRATCVTTLDQAGFPSRDIMAVSGHKSESSIKIYAKTSDGKKKEMSGEIGKQLSYVPAPQPRAEATSVAAIAGTSQTTLAMALEQPSTSREPLAVMQPPQARQLQRVPMALSLSENNLSTTSHTFNISDCVVHIHNH